MEKVFIVRQSPSNSFVFLWIALFLSVFFSVYLEMYWLFTLLTILFSIAVLADLIKYLISFYVGFVLKVDFEKREVILNHSLWFYKKRIALDDVLEIRIEKEKGYLITSSSIDLTKRQKFLSKGDGNSYKIHLTSVSVDYLKLLKTVFVFYSDLLVDK